MILIALAGVIKFKILSKDEKQDFGSYQAVFLSNSEAYFGKLEMNGEDYVIEDVYYFQRRTELQQKEKAGTEEPAPNLIKLGSEVHGPEDKMIIPRESVLYWENIKSEGIVGKAISDHKNKKQQ